MARRPTLPGLFTGLRTRPRDVGTQQIYKSGSKGFGGGAGGVGPDSGKLFPVRLRSGFEVTDDDAIADTAAVAAAVDGTVVLGRDVTVADEVVIDADGLGFDGRGCTITAVAPAGCIRFGGALGTVGTRLGTIGNFKFDGGGVAARGVMTNLINGDVDPIAVGNLAANAHAFTIWGQNANYRGRLTCAATGTGFCFVIDNGAGGNNIENPNPQGGNQFLITQTVDSTGYGYAVPQDNVTNHGVFDNPVPGTYAVLQRAGAFNVFRDSNIFHTSAARIVCFEPNTGGYTGPGYINGQLHFEGRTEIIGSGGTAQAAFGADFVSGGAAGGMASDIALVVTGRLIISGVGYDVHWGSSTPAEFANVDIIRYGSRVGGFWTPDGSGAWSYPVGEISAGGLTAVNAFPTGPATFSVPVGKVQGQTVEASDGGHSLLAAISGGIPVLYFDGDVDLFRQSAGVLATSGSMSVGGQLRLPTSGTGGGLLLGGDVNLYRAAADTLYTDDDFWAQTPASGPRHIGVTDGLASIEASLRADSSTGRARLGLFPTEPVAGKLVLIAASYPSADDYFHMFGDGKMEWGDGILPPDVNLYRVAPNTLKTDDDFKAGGGIVLKDGATSQVALGDMGGGVPGMFFGNAYDTNLYRYGAGGLGTGGWFRAISGVEIGSVAGDYINQPGAGVLRTASRFDSMPAGAGAISFLAGREGVGGYWYLTNFGDMFFGDGSGTYDTRLYRRAANVLRTDDDFEVGTNLTVAGNADIVGHVYAEGAIIHPSASDLSIYTTSAGQRVILQSDGGSVQVRRYSDFSPLLAVDDATGLVEVVNKLSFGGLTLIDAKGDLIAGSGADAVGRLPVGANGQALVADSTQTLGLKWDTPPGGPPSGAAGGALDGSYPNPGLAASVAGAGLAEAADVLSVNVDGATLEINADALRVKAGGIGTNEIATDGVGQAEIAADSVGKAELRVLGSGSGNALAFGATEGGTADTDLYRNSAGALQSSGALYLGTDLVVRLSAAEQIIMGQILTNKSGIIFGNAQATNLYEAAANSLKTDDKFTAALGLDAGSNEVTNVASATAASSAIPRSQGDSRYMNPPRILLDVASTIVAAGTTARYLLGSQGDTFGAWRDGVNVGTLAAKVPPPMVHINSADYAAIGTLTPKLRLRCAVDPNATAPGENFTFGLHAVQAPAGAANTLTLNCNDTAESGSTVAISTPPASTDTAAASSADFAIPANGRYFIACLTSGTLAANSVAYVSAQLSLVYV